MTAGAFADAVSAASNAPSTFADMARSSSKLTARAFATSVDTSGGAVQDPSPASSSSSIWVDSIAGMRNESKRSRAAAADAPIDTSVIAEAAGDAPPGLSSGVDSAALTALCTSLAAVTDSQIASSARL